MNEFELRRKLRALNEERQPKRDLWAGIQGQLTNAEPWRPTRSSRHMLWPWATAASVAFAVLAGLFLSQRFAATTEGFANEGSSDGTSIVSAGESRPRDEDGRVPGNPILEREADALRASYGAAIAATLDDRIVARPDFVAAGRELDAAAESLRSALSENPQSTFLLDLLRRTEERRLMVAKLAAA